MKQILILSSNPKGTPVLDLAREIREIREGLLRSLNQKQINIEARGAVRPREQYQILVRKAQFIH
ncbi:MAG: hypothetical protein ACRC1Z_06200 [Waterburya sp.]